MHLYPFWLSRPTASICVKYAASQGLFRALWQDKPQLCIHHKLGNIDAFSGGIGLTTPTGGMSQVLLFTCRLSRQLAVHRHCLHLRRMTAQTVHTYHMPVTCSMTAQTVHVLSVSMYILTTCQSLLVLLQATRLGVCCSTRQSAALQCCSAGLPAVPSSARTACTAGA